ncbi:hypothetical protein OBBRIDRAFT_334553 [Obba rivulosa]|uniref:Uncharacterized protein n=1 Tax=Obba rivulosa TaxID=1052685 RepID=A0A8E2DFT1_9APHY|nr:hypothetical protein OBBRIDRAFT_334553 [Obba rivulosa]
MHIEYKLEGGHFNLIPIGISSVSHPPASRTAAMLTSSIFATILGAVALASGANAVPQAPVLVTTTTTVTSTRSHLTATVTTITGATTTHTSTIFIPARTTSTQTHVRTLSPGS